MAESSQREKRPFNTGKDPNDCGFLMRNHGGPKTVEQHY